MRFVRIMATAMDAGDAYTHGRAYRCSKYATRVGRRMGLTDAEIHHLECAGLLQDLGKKIALHGISQKAGELTQLERVQMNQHTQISADILGRISFLKEASKIISAMNERFDGHGLPDHLIGNEIPLASRILAVVSALDALLSNRPHRRGLNAEAAYAELRKEAGHRFDPKVVDTVIRLHWLGEITADFDTRMAFVYKLPDAQPLARRPGALDTPLGVDSDEETDSEMQAFAEAMDAEAAATLEAETSSGAVTTMDAGSEGTANAVAADAMDGDPAGTAVAPERTASPSISPESSESEDTQKDQAQAA